MKYIITLIILFTSLLFAGEKQKITIGAGAYVQSQPYANVNTIVLPSPVIFLIMGYFMYVGRELVFTF